jgi:hypothetical protein
MDITYNLGLVKVTIQILLQGDRGLLNFNLAGTKLLETPSTKKGTTYDSKNSDKDNRTKLLMERPFLGVLEGHNKGTGKEIISLFSQRGISDKQTLAQKAQTRT